jgi:ATP synthase protein I
MKKNNDVWKSFAMVTQLGLTVLAPIIICIGLGWFLEEKFSIDIMALLLILGILAGARNAWALCRQMITGNDDDDDDE